ncbi:MAG: tryptophan--tRNA ligase [Oscillospiraceae bacterium]|jgi:tryptophanyl-tRNA synthetase|nr:tryptophan--tRNA ligase [Oscillospiraceae bacterium]
MTFDKNKKNVFSAIQPSGTMTLGNYLGAIKNWIPLQEEYNCIFSLVDLHTITVRQDPKEFHKNILEAYALFLACGVDSQKSIFFIQSHVHTHAELAWVLTCYTQFGELSRMTQFKDKSSRYSENINAGLFCYPDLMAADILLYNTHLIPVGIDQKQHVELARDIAGRFNGIYGDVFTIPEPLIPKVGAKIMSLQDPAKKMSKSDSNVNAYISVLDSEEDVLKKFKRAVTDSNSEIKYSGSLTGVDNLLNIYCCVTGRNINDAENEFRDKGYKYLKESVANAVTSEFKSIQSKFNTYIKDLGYIEKCYKEAAKEAYGISKEIISKVFSKVGFILK